MPDNNTRVVLLSAAFALGAAAAPAGDPIAVDVYFLPKTGRWRQHP